MKIFLALFSVSFLFSCASMPEKEKAEGIDLAFGRYTLQIPSNMLVMADLGEGIKGLAFVYGYENADRSPSLYNQRLTVRYVTQDELVPAYKQDCNFSLFIDDLYRDTEKSSCGSEALIEFYNELLDGRDYGIWDADNINIYYVVGDKMIDVTITSPDRPNLLIQSNFLTKEQMKAIMSEYIND